ncbi:hypothetical protein B4N84_25995 [Flavobacterium sp. IR1]|nr:hypothetical protein B4N84_25995 [Flavobacterium sp. IR1]
MSNWTTGLVAKKYKKHWNIVIIIFIVVLVFISFFQESAEKINYKTELNQNYKGIVLNKYIDSSDHSICKLKLKTGKIINVWDNCYEKVNIGDSIVKKKGSFNFFIYKPSGFINVNIEDNLIIPKKQ